MNSEFMSTTHLTDLSLRETMVCGCDLEVMIEALQASCPGSNPGVRTLPYRTCFFAGVAKHGQRRRT